MRAPTDARSDLLGPPWQGGGTVSPQRADGDIVRTVFRHTDRRIRVRVSLTELRRNFEVLSLIVPVRTNEGLNRYVVLAVDRDEAALPWSGDAGLYRPSDDGWVQWCGVHRSIDYTANDLVIGFSRRCVGNPRWVRLGAQLHIWVTQAEDYYDDALLESKLAESGDAALSRPIHRGSTGAKPSSRESASR